MANMKSQGEDSTIYVISYPKGLTLEWLLNLIIEGKKTLRVNRITLNVWKFFKKKLRGFGQNLVKIKYNFCFVS